MVHIRPAQPSDAQRVTEMTRAVSAHEGMPPPQFDEQAFLRDGFGDARLFRCLVAELEGSIVGHVAVTKGYDFQEGRATLWIADLYVEPDQRRQGIARMLVAEVMRHAVDEGCGFVQWMIGSDNETAKTFYASIGAKFDGGQVMFLRAEET